MSFLSDASYRRFLDARLRSLDDAMLGNHVREKFEVWRRQYRICRLIERAAELLAAETERPNALYLGDETDLELLSLLARRHRFDSRVFRGFLVEEGLWDKLQPEWFSPFPVCRVADWQDREDTVVISLSECKPLRDNGRDRGNDFSERFINLGRYQDCLRLREDLRGRATIVLYADYKKVQTLAAIAGQITRHPSTRYKTMVLLDDPNAQAAGYDFAIREPFFYLWPLILHLLNPDILHINVGWGTQGVPFALFVQDENRAVIDFYDVLALVRDEDLVRGGHREPARLTRASERYLFSHFRNIVHRYHESINPRLRERFRGDSNLLSVHEYLRDPVYSIPAQESDAIRLVYGGDMIVSNDPANPLYPWTVGMMKHFPGGNLHLYLYPNPWSTNFQRCEFLEELARMLGVANVHSCVPLREDEYVRAIAEYDFGLIGPTPESTRPIATGYGLPFKVITYLRAGLPIVVPEDFTMAANMVREHEIGVVYAYDELDRIPVLLAGLDLPRLKANVIRCRDQFRIEKGAAKVQAMYAGMLQGDLQGQGFRPAFRPTSMPSMAVPGRDGL